MGILITTPHRMKLISGTAGVFMAALLLLPRPAMGEEGLAYTVKISGVETRALRAMLRNASDLVAIQDRPPATMSILKKRVEEDAAKLLQVLKSEGYFSAHVDNVVEEEARPVRIEYRVDAGPVFTLAKAQVEVSGDLAVKEKLPPVAGLGLQLGKPAKANALLAAKAKLERAVGKLGFPYPNVAPPDVVVDTEAGQVAVTYRVDTGLAGRFGATTFAGNEAVEESFLRGLLAWKEGDRWNVEQIDKTWKKLTATNLFSRIEIVKGAKPGDEGRVPMTVTVSERKPRTIKAGVSYMTDEGAGARVSWEHRNLFGRGERLQVSATVSEIAYGLEGVYTIPSFRRPDQALTLKARAAHEDTEAFTSQSERAEATLERRLSEKLVVGAGLAAKSSDVLQAGQRNTYDLVYVPGYLDWDARDNVLDPSKGGRFTLKVTPFHDLLHGNLTFAQALAGYNQHVQVLDKPRLVLAGRAALGTMTGASLEGIPADDRFYAGGGSSVRGYPYQTIGPLKDNKPVGGRSLLELSGEMRMRLTERVGLVLFADGGSAFRGEVPTLDGSLRWGAGLGLRYFSPLGPLRLDVAVPLQPRHAIDDAFEIYLSMGQAF